MIDLQSFIEEALVAIATGVQNASQKTTQWVVIGPRVMKTTTTMHKRSETETKARVEQVEFDIAVTVTTEDKRNVSASAGGNVKSDGIIKVVAADASVEGQVETDRGNSTTDTRVSRLKFRVPILFQCQDVLITTQIFDSAHPDPKKAAAEWNAAARANDLGEADYSTPS
jgi:hypothetical protein